MKLIEPHVEIIPQEEGLLGVYKQIEIAGRTCYKSEDKITKDSATEFVQKMINSGHTAMLEHGTIYLYLEETSDSLPQDFDEVYSIVNRYKQNAFSKVSETNTATLASHRNRFYITTNLRVLVENEWLGDLQYWSEPTVWHHQRATVRFTCDRGVSHELVRHKKLCVA